MAHASVPTPAIFTRNHDVYLRGAAKRNRKNPNRLTTFRSETVWRTAARLLDQYGTLPVYIAVIGAPNRVQYSARLRRLDLHPHMNKAATRRMAKHLLPSTKNERVWTPGEGTFYALSHVRPITPAPFSRFLKWADGTALDSGFRYSYAILRALPADSLEVALVADDIAEPPLPARKMSVVSRVVRDSALVRDLKARHRNQCQVCGTVVRLENGMSYSEGHHLKPLGAEHPGPDVGSNILIVCPNHHAALDLKGLTVRPRKLRMAPGHRIDERYLRYHNALVAADS